MLWDHHAKKSQVTARVQVSVLDCFNSQHEEPPVEGSLASALVAHLHYPHLTSRKNRFLCECLYVHSNTSHAQYMLCHYLMTRTWRNMRVKEVTVKLKLLSLYLCRRTSVLPQRNGEQLPIPICGILFEWGFNLWFILLLCLVLRWLMSLFSTDGSM